MSSLSEELVARDMDVAILEDVSERSEIRTTDKSNFCKNSQDTNLRRTEKLPKTGDLDCESSTCFSQNLQCKNDSDQKYENMVSNGCKMLMIAGGKVSISVGFTAMFLSLVLGTFIGVLAGQFKKLDGPLMRFTDL